MAEKDAACGGYTMWGNTESIWARFTPGGTLTVITVVVILCSKHTMDCIIQEFGTTECNIMCLGTEGSQLLNCCG
jgi:hypothetical protein